MENEKTLREKVFEACNVMAQEKINITRSAVRARTGGSDRDISKYIAEWKAEYQKNALAMSTSNELSQQSEESNSINNGNVPNSVPNLGTGAYSQNPQSDIEIVARRGAERAAAMLAGENALIGFFLENPDKLPEDLKQKVEAVTTRSNQIIERRQQQYNPDFFVQQAIAQFQ